VGDKINELGFDSISFIKLVVELENRLGIEFEDTMLDYKSIDTVADLINLIENIGNVGFSRFAGHSV
jgi:acyl carrier protein